MSRTPLFTPPRFPPLRWLADPGVPVVPEVRSSLLGMLLSSPSAVVMAVANGWIINVLCVFLHYDLLFVTLLIVDGACGIARIAYVVSTKRNLAAGRQPWIGPYIALAVVWCALQGTIAFAAMLTGNTTLQTLMAALIIGIIGPVVARNYSAPRLALLMAALCDLPFVAGACLSGNPWLYSLLPLTPPYLYGLAEISRSLQQTTIKMLTGELEGERRARRDHLTGLVNRLGFDETMDSLFVDGRALTMFCLDLDGFKRINDTLGHPAGDSLLRLVARRLEHCVRAGDLVIRLGGDEFVVLAADLSIDQADRFAERIIESIMSEPYLLDDKHRVRIGVSIGLACAPQDAADAATLHRKADHALYASKAAGKGVHRRLAGAA